MTDEKWNHLRYYSEKLNKAYLSCERKHYRITQTHYRTGESPCWDVEEIKFVDVPMDKVILRDYPDDLI